ALPLTKQQIPKGWPSGVVKARDFAIQDSTFDAQMFHNPLCKLRKAVKDVSISGNQFASTVCDVGERTEAVNLQFVDEVIGVERPRSAGKPHGAQVSGQHARSL